MTPGGETGYLGLQSNLDELLADQEDAVMNAVLPGRDPMLVFICPETKGVYRGFAYDAIAISRYNADVMKTVDESAFGRQSPKQCRLQSAPCAAKADSYRH